MKDNLKIEINYMLRHHVLDVDHRRILIPWLAQDESIVTVHPIEIFGSKITALINRNAPRDLYDVHNMIRAAPIPVSEQDMLRKCIVFYISITSEPTPFELPVEQIANISPLRIKSELIPVLRRGERFDAAAAGTVIRDYLRQILNLTEQEKEYLHLFAAKQYRPELLFEDSDALTRIVHHPMAVWKCEAKDAQPTLPNQ